jgi:hypothetical protein
LERSAVNALGDLPNDSVAIKLNMFTGSDFKTTSVKDGVFLEVSEPDINEVAIGS